MVFSSGRGLCTSTVVVTEPTLQLDIHGRLLLDFQRNGAWVALSKPAACTVRMYRAAGSVGSM